MLPTATPLTTTPPKLLITIVPMVTATATPNHYTSRTCRFASKVISVEGKSCDVENPVTWSAFKWKMHHDPGGNFSPCTGPLRSAYRRCTSVEEPLDFSNFVSHVMRERILSTQFQLRWGGDKGEGSPEPVVGSCSRNLRHPSPNAANRVSRPEVS